jgi:hypothetical protein
MSRNSSRLIGWWVLLLIGAAAALLVAWLARVVSVPVATLVTIGAVVLGLSWLAVLVTVPWNLYFAARRAVTDMAVSRQRSIAVRDADNAEAGQIARRMLRFALAAHLGSAAAAGVVAVVSGNTIGYYVAGLFLLATVFRPAAAYLMHVRERIRVLTRESAYPRDDVATLRDQVNTIAATLAELRAELEHLNGDLRRTECTLTDDIAHARELLSTDLTRLADAQAADRTATRSHADELARRIDAMVRRIEATLDGLSDHQELITGLRALVRMVRSDQA